MCTFHQLLSGGYEDDEDLGEWFLYPRSGGRDLIGNELTKLYVSVARKIILFELLNLTRRRDLHILLRRGCDTMEFIGLKNVGEKLESRVSRFVDIYLSNATMIVLHGQVGGGRTLRSQKKIMKCTNDISDFLKDPQTLVREGSLTPMHKSLLVSTLKNFAGILSKIQHGHHVIMHCLRRFSNNLTKDLVEEIAVNTVDLATNKSGCCVLQHCLEHVREGEQKRRL
ncbi:hypothetical protein LWI29_017794 [Acer saccharum]|uniref:Uncharacterized protein n=1 Tax=Acer saccharum TaxID=4024 RepID=A0AA39SEW9_ACESA|nr:hypothetical protein LWI29_017794 [Acer saccharum]